MFKLCITSDLGFEFWQDIPEYEGLYQASTLGRIRNHNGKILKPFLQKKGYLRIRLSGGKKFLVHTLICQTFFPQKSGKLQINHKSEVKTENQVWNLEYCDCFYNNNYGTRNKRLKESLTNNPKKSKPIIQTDLNGNKIATYASIQDVQRKTGYYSSSICKCCKGGLKTAYGYVWKYA